MIDTRPVEIESRLKLGHWEIDTVHGKGRKSIVTLVERATGYVMMGQLNARTVAALNKLNNRPRKRYDYQTLQEMLGLLTSVALHS